MKIAFVAPRYPQVGVVGGCETLLANLAKHLAKRGDDVHFLTTCATNHHSWENDVAPGASLEDGITIHRFLVDANRDIARFLHLQGRIDRFESLSLSEEREWISNSVNSTSLVEFAETGNFDAVLTGPYLFGLTHGVVAKLAERTWLVPALHDESYAYLAIMGELFRSVRSILFNSLPEKQLAEKLYQISEDKGSVVGMGMEPFDVDKGRFLSSIKSGTPYAIYCGRRELGKGTPLLLDYFDLYRKRTSRDVKLVLTGTGPVEPPATLEPHILDLGYASEEVKHHAMADAACFIHCGTKESFGIVLLEAWLARIPVLVHAHCDALRYLCSQSGGGLWFRHYLDFEACFNFILDNPKVAAQFAEHGRQHVVNNYSWEAIGKKLTAALEVKGVVRELSHVESAP